MVVDYSETINKYTQLDAYPLPKIEEMVNKIAQYKVFSTIDLRSAYYQIPLSEKDKIYTAFEADARTLAIHTHAIWRHEWKCSLPKENGYSCCRS